MRAFVALWPPPEALDHLGEHLAPREEAGGGLRWTLPESRHLTLAFLADLDEWRVEPLVERLEGVAARRPGFALALRGAGCFPDVSRARVLYVHVDDPSGALPALAAAVRGAGNAVGAAPDGARFRPHVTLARLPRPTDATRWVRALSPYAGPAWTAASLTLVASHLGEGPSRRPRYETLAEVPLAAPTEAD